MDSRERQVPLGKDSLEAFYGRVPGLVRDLELGSTAWSARARDALIEGANQFKVYDPVLIVVEQVQKSVLREPKRRVLERAAEFLRVFLDRTGNARPGGVGEVILNLDDPKISQTIEQILENDRELIKREIAPFFPGIYGAFVDNTVTFAERAKSGGVRKIKLVETKEEDVSLQREALDKWNDWNVTVGKLLNEETLLSEPEKRDQFVSLLKVEPDAKEYGVPERAFTAARAGVSLADIEKMPYPLAREDFQRVTDYLISVLQPAGFTELEQTFHRLRITHLFFLPTFFHKQFEPARLENKNLLANLNYWQEQFLFHLVLGSDPQIDDPIKKVLTRSPDYARSALFGFSLPNWVTKPFILDPDYRGEITQAAAINYSHPFMGLALDDYAQRMGLEGYRFHFSDVLARDYFLAVLLPRLKQKLGDLGVAEICGQVIEDLETHLKSNSIEESHLKQLRETFEYLGGTEFINKLSKHSKELENLTQLVWDSIFEEKEAHFLPMQEGLNVIEFSSGSAPEILGFRQVLVNRIGTLPDWEINVRFDLLAGAMSISGVLDQNGTLKLDGPKEEIPGFYTILNLLAVLVAHDLMVQEKKERKEKKERTKEQEERRVRLNGSSRQTTDRSESTFVSKGGFLPRVQTDVQLVEDVYQRTGFKQRKVELHRTHLPHWEDYETAVALYNEALASGASEQELTYLKGELEAARQKAYKISEAKREKIPAKLKLKTVIDPVTQEVRYLQTWVVEHTSPKPTKEELQSPIKLYLRYYRGSSALSWVDQLKPWFIGE